MLRGETDGIAPDLGVANFVHVRESMAVITPRCSRSRTCTAVFGQADKRLPRQFSPRAVLIAVFLVDDPEVVRRGLVDLINNDPDLTVIGEVGIYAHALARIPALRPNVEVLDVRLPDGDRIELCKKLHSKLPEVKCLPMSVLGGGAAMSG